MYQLIIKQCNVIITISVTDTVQIYLLTTNIHNIFIKGMVIVILG